MKMQIVYIFLALPKGKFVAEFPLHSEILMISLVLCFCRCNVIMHSQKTYGCRPCCFRRKSLPKISVAQVHSALPMLVEFKIRSFR